MDEALKNLRHVERIYGDKETDGVHTVVRKVLTPLGDDCGTVDTFQDFLRDVPK